MQTDRAFRQCERLFVAVPNQRDVGLVAIHRRQHIVRLQECREALRLAQCGICLIVPTGLREHHRRQRMDHRQVTAIAGGVKRRRRLGDVFTHDRHVADLPITLAEIKMRQPDRPRIVRPFGLLEGAVVKGDGPGLFASGKRHAPVQSPKAGVQDLRQWFANGIG